MPIKQILLLSLTIIVLFESSVAAFECTVCHSKNPKMVAMHKAVEGKNCFGCHKIGEKLMGRGHSKDMNSLLKRRVSDAECLPCHGRQE